MPHTTTEYPIRSLLEMAEDKRLVVPDFQRPFKWKAANVKKLCESLFLRIPFGTSLLLKANTVTFQYRAIDELDISPVLDDTNEDIDDSNDLEEEYVNDEFEDVEDVQNQAGLELFFILDGQQRITSLHKIFRADLMPDEKELDGLLGGLRFFLNLELFDFPLGQNLGTNSDIIVAKKWDEIVRQISQRNPNSDTINRDTYLDYCIDQGLFPITRAILNQGINLSHDFLNKMAIKLALRSQVAPQELFEKLPQYQRDVTDWFDTKIQPMFTYISDYRFSALVLENVSLETLTAIFETINTTGMKLSLYDLLVSKLGTFSEGNEKTTLPKLLRKYVDESYLDIFDESSRRLGGLLSQQSPKVFVLETKRLAPERLGLIQLKQSDILKDEYREYFREIAPSVAKGLNNSIDFHYRSLYVFLEKYIPVKDTISILASLKQIPNVSIQKLTAIYWYIVFFIRFDQSTNRILEKIYEDSLPALLSNDFSIFSEKLDEFPEFQQFLTSSNKTSFSKALLTYVHSNSSKDWSGNELNRADLVFEDHHIFPSAWLRDNCLRNVSENRRKLLFNSVLNKLRVSKSANRSARAQAPYQYLVTTAEFSTQSYRRLLLPDSFREDSQSPRDSDQFEALLEERYLLIRDNVQAYLREAFSAKN